MSGKQRVLILGGGVAGIRVAKNASSRIRAHGWEVALIDQNEYHQYLYRIHEVCNTEYRERDIIVPLGRLLKQVDLKKATVKALDTERKVVVTDSGDESYDLLVLAMGSHPAFFNIPGIAEHSMTLGSYSEARAVKARIEELFDASTASRVSPKIVIGGGGFTGIELAGELADSLPSLCRERGIPLPDPLLTVVEAMPTILPGWDVGLASRAQSFLESRGVKFLLGRPVTGVGERRLELKDGTILEPELVIWTGGVMGDPACSAGFEIKGRRIVVDEYLRAKGHEDIFVAGDMACTTDQAGAPQPPTAHIAMVQGDLVARNLIATIDGGDLGKYRYERVGEIVTLGRKYAVGELFGIRFTGLSARIMKKVVHFWYVFSIGGLRLLLGL